jgi:hypothetical protein
MPRLTGHEQAPLPMSGGLWQHAAADSIRRPPQKEKSGQNRLGRLNIFWEGTHDCYFQR